MAEPLGRLRRFLRELKRRNVYRVAVTYAVVGFILIQAADLIFPALNIPSWAYSLVVVLILFGFPVALVLAWAFEVTPEGVRRTPEAEEMPESARGGAGGWIAAVVVLLLAGGGFWYLTAGGGEEPAARTAGPTDTAGDRSLAVLPFDNLSGTEEAEPFVNGIHDDLLTRLSNVSDLKVISRTSVLPYRKTELSLPAIADSLGVAWIVEGGVQQAGDQVQVNAQLIQAEADAHQWAETYRRELTTENLFAVQSELTKKIARSLEAELSPEETKRIERRPTENLEAYRLYVQGRSSLYQRTESGTRRALTYFRRAIERDSSYALAWSGLADALLLRTQYGYRRPDEGRVDAAAAARRALTLDSTLAEAHASYGRAVAEGFDALRAYRRAIDLKPSYPQAYHWLAFEEWSLGRLDSAVAHLERAVRLDPTAAVLRAALAAGYLFSGRDSAAVREIRRAVEWAPSLGVAHLGEGFTLTEVGRHEEALAAFDRGFQRAAEASLYRSTFGGWPGIAHARAGHRDQAKKAAASLAGAEAGALKRSLIYLALGDTGRAASALGEADPGGWGWLHAGLYRYGPSPDPLRGTSEYQAALRKLNTSLGLRPDGSVPDSVDLPLAPHPDE